MIHRLVRIRTPSRLHFGLLGWGPEAPRQFGGVGLMIQSPEIELTAERADHWQVEGMLSHRVQRLIGRLQAQLPDSRMRLGPSCIRILRAPPEHQGLGVGTQVSLAVASAVLDLTGGDEPSLEELARLTGRGHRSGIGLHGFRSGGLIVDGGRNERTLIPPLVSRLAFPEEWSILVIQPSGSHGLHGAGELQAFAGLTAIPERVTERLCRLVLLDIIPAVQERDLATFGSALMELQSHVGAAFAPAQGGVYAPPLGAPIVEELGRLGFVGIGQSSWGPTLYAFSDRHPDEVMSLSNRLRQRLSLDSAAIQITRADNHGATRTLDA